MTAFGPLLARVLVDVGGAQTPIDTSMGLVKLARATRGIPAHMRMELFDEAFGALSLSQQRRREDPNAPPVDAEAIFYKAREQIPDIQANGAAKQSGYDAGLAAFEACAQQAGLKRGSDGSY
eukprot:7389911-Prymnesium_polylepis.1